MKRNSNELLLYADIIVCLQDKRLMHFADSKKYIPRKAAYANNNIVVAYTPTEIHVC